MSEGKYKTKLFEGFKMPGWKNLVWLGAVIIAAFLLGGLFLGDSNKSMRNEHTGHDPSADAPAKATMWTCSMHPQIKLHKEGKCPICFMALIPLDQGSGDELGPRQLRMSDTARQLAQIQTTPARRALAEAEVRMVGKISYDESRLAYITAWFPGRLDRLFADFTGITVSKGDHLVQIYSPELLATQEELIQAKNAVMTVDSMASPILHTTAHATLKAAREKLRLFGLTTDQIKTIETSGKATDHLTIYAPIGGVVVHKEAKEGMYVTTGSRIYTIADLSRLWILFEAYESDLPWLRYGQRLDFTSLSFPGEKFEAVISFIDPLVDPKTRTVKIRAMVDNKQNKLKPDMFVSGSVKSLIDRHGNIVDEDMAGKWISPMHPEIVKDGPGQCDVCGMDLVPAASLGYAGKAQDVKASPLLIPASAPLITGKRAVVYVEVPNDEGLLYEGREIELGPRAGEFYVVKEGIEEGELVVTNGAFKIDSELQIHAKPSMMSPEGGISTVGHQHDATQAAAASHTQQESMPETSIENKKVQKALIPVYTAYFDVQIALAKDNLADAKVASKTLAGVATKVDMTLFSPKGHAHWMEFSKKLIKHSGALSTSKDIESARDSFFHLSNAILATHRTFGHSGDVTYYLTHCPMARGGDGADWLQKENIVWNSFYGASMLRCGTIKEITLQKSKENN